MNHQKLKDYFQNKICTVLPNEHKFPIKDQLEHTKFFTGEVVDLDSDGVWLKSLEYKTIAFFSFPICGIIEEQFIHEDSNKGQKIKEELSKNNLISIESLTQKVKSLKK